MNLSIIIPVYNNEKYIESCIKSILTSEVDKNKVEIIVVDDGSTDNSRLICDKYVNENFKIYSNSNHGVSYSRNFGISVSSGEFIMFVDSDDELSPNWYDKVSKYFDSEDDIIVFSKEINRIPGEKKEVLDNIVGIDNFIGYLSSPFSKFYRRTFLEKKGIKFYEDVINGEDMLFNVKCFLETDKYTFVRSSIYKYRIHATSSTKKFDANFIKYDINFQKNLLETLSCGEIRDEQVLIITSFCKKNSLIIIAQRLCYSGRYKIFKENKYIFEEYFKKYNSKVNLGIRKETIILLLRCKMYFLTYFILRMIKKIKKDNKTSYFVEI